MLSLSASDGESIRKGILQDVEFVNINNSDEDEEPAKDRPDENDLTMKHEQKESKKKTSKKYEYPISKEKADHLYEEAGEIVCVPVTKIPTQLRSTIISEYIKIALFYS